MGVELGQLTVITACFIAVDFGLETKAGIVNLPLS